MKTTRRFVIAGAATLPFIGLQAQAQVVKPKITDSPMFKIFDSDGEYVYILSSSYNSETKKPTIQILKSCKNERIQIDSIEEAEDYFLNRIPVQYDYDTSIKKNLNMNILCCYRAANNIAITTRLGAGNTYLMHPETFQILMKSEVITPEEFSNKIKIGRWTSEGSIHQIATIYSSEIMPKNEIIAEFNNKNNRLDVCDGPGMVIRDSTGKLGLALNNSSFAGNEMRYFAKIRFNTI